MTIYIVRHAEAKLNTLTEQGIEASKEKGRNIWIMTEGIKDEVLILTSPESRAIQTAGNIRIGLKSNDIEIRKLDSLDDKHVGGETSVLMDLIKLPQYSILVLVTHQNYMYKIAQKLGYTGGKLLDESYLEDYEVEVEEYGPIFKRYRI